MIFMVKKLWIEKDDDDQITSGYGIIGYTDTAEEANRMIEIAGMAPTGMPVLIMQPIKRIWLTSDGMFAKEGEFLL